MKIKLVNIEFINLKNQLIILHNKQEIFNMSIIDKVLKTNLYNKLKYIKYSQYYNEFINNNRYNNYSLSYINKNWNKYNKEYLELYSYFKQAKVIFNKLQNEDLYSDYINNSLFKMLVKIENTYNIALKSLNSKLYFNSIVEFNKMNLELIKFIKEYNIKE